ncbi:uncharacterized protein H6S33_009988 [Morchella sextelata]|uniref:uncharacterized protein n=1 Tax=Morchella sextelata TaxID=1174677 RepID=UPI001D04FFBE|nr:uncharacterized protein H6S33_009988 [Morchella sextelata]KAH0611936.1 hypothetical protein H6S33_009988 [Morchella sextelata]
MSLESALEEERLEILKLLERPSRASVYQHASGAYSTPSSPRQQYNSVLPPHHSHPPPPRAATTITWSPTVTQNVNGRHRSESGPVLNGPPKLLKDRDKQVNSLTPNDAYNFSMMPSVAPPIPRKPRSRDPSAAPSARGSIGRRSISPNTGELLREELLRSASPRSSVGRLSSPSRQNPRIAMDNEPKIDLGHAYARLNDQALASSGGILGTGESLTSEGGVRLQKDYDLEGERAPEDSSEEESSSLGSSPGSEEEDKEERGRPGSRSRRIDGAKPSFEENTRESSGIIKSMIRSVGDPGGGVKKKGKKGGGIDAKKGTGNMRRTSMSLLAAAEEERKEVSSRYKVRSLLPSISITPSGSTVPGANSPTTSRRTGVHPTTNFDLPSHTSTPMSSDTEADVLDLRRAQRMDMSVSPIVSTPESQRVVRTILRGEYAAISKEAEEGNRRVRKYLVATDLSGEAQHALEWTIGTVLRDGDTLMAIYAIDQDSVEDGGKIVSDDGIIADMTTQLAVGSNQTLTSGTQTPGSASPRTPFQVMERSERSRERTKAEQERFVAAEAITSLVSKLLKKTRLQVKCTVEVIHCKSPKHLLTEIIDLVEPTLVVLGSRGRSALKGVLLGSFSNYLVTKSSVPVMVARKKLKHTKKYANTNVRLANNLTANATTRQLADAKVD